MYTYTPYLQIYYNWFLKFIGLDNDDADCEVKIRLIINAKLGSS